MNTYKLRSTSVESQNAARSPGLFIGLDVHNDSIAISIAPSDSTEVRRWGIIGGTHEHVQRFIKQIQAAHPEATLQFCYEAGPRGFPLVRFLRGLGHECIVVCPSRVPRRPGDRVKTDRRDADQLARLLRAGELTGIHVPEPEDEALRDLLRSRDQVRRAQHPRPAATENVFVAAQHPLRGKEFVDERRTCVTWRRSRCRSRRNSLPCRSCCNSDHRGGRTIGTLRRAARARGGGLALGAGGAGAHEFARRGAAQRGHPRGRAGRPPSLHAAAGVDELPGPGARANTPRADRQQGGITKMGNGHARRALVEAARTITACRRGSRRICRSARKVCPKP